MGYSAPIQQQIITEATNGGTNWIPVIAAGVTALGGIIAVILGKGKKGKKDT